MIDGCPHCYFPTWAGNLGGTLGGIIIRSPQQPPELILAQDFTILSGTAHLPSDILGGRNNHALDHAGLLPAQPDPRGISRPEGLLLTSSGPEQAAWSDGLDGRATSPAAMQDPLRPSVVGLAIHLWEGLSRCLQFFIGGFLPRGSFGHRAPPSSVDAVSSRRRRVNQTWLMDALSVPGLV